MVRKESSTGPAGFDVMAVTIIRQLCCAQPLFKEAHAALDPHAFPHPFERREVVQRRPRERAPVLTVVCVAVGYRPG